MKKIILASNSPRRKQLLQQIGLKFQAIGSDYEEDMTEKLPPMQLAKKLSLGKAKALTNKYKNHIIIGADTFIVFKNKLLGKPHTEKIAISTLKSIGGKCIYVVSGVSIIDTSKNKIISESIRTKIFIKKLSNEEIYNYVQTKEPLDKAGAFGIQELGAIFVEKIEGDYYAIVGLPLNLLYNMLKEFDIHII